MKKFSFLVVILIVILIYSCNPSNIYLENVDKHGTIIYVNKYLSDNIFFTIIYFNNIIVKEEGSTPDRKRYIIFLNLENEIRFVFGEYYFIENKEKQK